MTDEPRESENAGTGFGIRDILLSAARKAAPFSAAFLLGRTGLFTGLFPFGQALIASAGHGSIVAAVLGAIAGYIIPGSGADTLRMCATALAVAGLRWSFAELDRVSRSPAFPPIAALVGTVLTGTVVSISSGAALGYRMVIYLAEGMISAASAYFFGGAAEAVEDGLPVLGEDRQRTTCLLVSAVILAIPACGLRIAGFSPLTVPLVVITLACARKYRETGGAVAGIALGGAIALSGGGYIFAGVCAAAGLVASLFSQAGRIVCAAAFAAVCAAGSLGTGMVDISFLAETLLGSALFAAVRSDWLEGLLPDIREKNAVLPRSAADGGELAEKLRSAAAQLSAVSETVCEVSDRLDGMNAAGPDTAVRQAAERVCGGCAISGHCWGEMDSETRRRFARLAEEPADGQGAVFAEMSASCAKWSELRGEIEKERERYASRESARRRVAQIRSVVACQMGGVGDMLNELADSCTADGASDRLAETVNELIEESGWHISGLICRGHPDREFTVRFNLLRLEPDALSPEGLAAELGAELNIDLECECRGQRVVLTRVPPLAVCFGAAQHIRSGETLCGDAYDALCLGSSAAVILSDGMGCGGRAAVDAAMTCGLLVRLLRGGFGVKPALRVINSALLVRAEDESLATCDVARVDLFTGQTVLTKAGAAATFVRRGSRVSRVEPQSLPLGILRDVDCAERVLDLREGDVAVMVSDGAMPDDSEWLRAEMMAFDDPDPRVLARNIVALALSHQPDGSDDDITALVLCVTARETGEEETDAA